MIIFYNKKTGDVVGTIEGRVHDQSQLKVNIGVSGVDNKDIGKIICQWKVAKTWEKDGQKFVEFEPISNQKDIMILLDKNPIDVYKYKVKNELLIKK